MQPNAGSSPADAPTFINLLLTNNAVVKGATWGASPRGSIGLQVSTTQECEHVCFDN